MSQMLQERIAQSDENLYKAYHFSMSQYIRNWVGCPYTRYTKAKSWLYSWYPSSKHKKKD